MKAVSRIAAFMTAAAMAFIPFIASGADAPPQSASVFTRAYDTTSKTVTLTFDADYWSPGNPDEVVRILRDNGITAAFSLTGRYVEKFPDQTRTLLSAGHKLINHSYDHPYFTRLSQADRWAELDKSTG